MCFGIRILSLFHLNNLNIPIQNIKSPKNVKNACADLTMLSSDSLFRDLGWRDSEMTAASLMLLWPLRMSRLEELAPHRIISCKRKVHSGAEVCVKVSYFRKIYHFSPGCANSDDLLIEECLMTIHQVTVVEMEKTRSRIAAPTLLKVDGGLQFTVVHERVDWYLKDLFLWKGLETSKTSLMYPWP